ncbi:Ribose transport system permease protein RbsC [Gimesia panareensis]|uniref:Ribose transport system permease protein RbsC n=1 Tax=Gimesia panareensis TaxID=2527978 RepID=A0A517Q6X2_9PLAN|nr:ABC transporter permease [Gimesia panareensis]QDT27377.1 Ribose transport system permease protein RbsC [Gimesia panareensis]
MTDSPAPVSEVVSESQTRGGLTYSLFQYAGLLGVLALLVLIFSLMSNHFLSRQTLVTVANNIPDLLVISVGMTLVLIIGGIDLSVGSLLALSSAVLGVCMVNWGWPLWAAVPVCLGIGILCGALNGAISVLAGIPSFIVTLGMLEMARGSAYLLTDSQTKYIGSSIEWIGVPVKGLLFSPAFLLALVIVAVGQYLLTRTVFGRYCVAIGTNAEAVRMSGIPTAPCSIAVFTISGLLCGLAGVMQTSRLSTADPNAAVGLELSAIAACVIGGTSLMGGRGSVVNTFFGVLIIAVLQTGLAQIGATDPIKRVITGAVIIVAVLLDAARQRWKRGG